MEGRKLKKSIIIIICLFCIIIIGTYFVITHFEKEENIDEEYQDYEPQEEISNEQFRQTMVKLYYLNKDSKELMAEIKMVDANILLKNPYGVLFELLMQKPESDKLVKIIPEGTKINNVFFEAGCVTIDVSQEFLNFDSNEHKYQIINSIVNTLTELNEVNSVKFLVDGNINENIDENYVKIN